MVKHHRGWYIVGYLFSFVVQGGALLYIIWTLITTSATIEAVGTAMITCLVICAIGFIVGAITVFIETTPKCRKE